MGVCSTTYYTHYNSLCSSNHVTPFKTFINGRFGENIYLLNDCPDIEKAASPLKADIIHIGESKKEACPKQKQAVKRKSLSESPPLIILSSEQIRAELWQARQIPYSYNQNRRLAETTVHYLTDFDESDKLMSLADTTRGLFCHALTDLICMPGTIQIRGAVVAYSHVIDRLIPFMEFVEGRPGLYSDYVSIAEMCDSVCDDYLSYCRNQDEISNPLKLMKTFIWTTLINGRSALDMKSLQ
jgi:hypothetical protein